MIMITNFLKYTTKILTITNTMNPSIEYQNKGEYRIIKRDRNTQYTFTGINTNISSYDISQTVMNISSWKDHIKGIESSSLTKSVDDKIYGNIKLSKPKFSANVILSNYTIDDLNLNCIKLELDKQSTNIILKDLSAIWCIEYVHDNRSHVNITSTAVINRFIPYYIIDYLSNKGFKYVTEWLKCS